MPRKRAYDTTETDELPKSFVTVKLYGKLAERWISERGSDSDASFVDYLLNLRNRYRLLQSSCQREAARKVDYISEKNDDEVPDFVGGEGSLSVADPNVRVNIEVEEGNCMNEIPIEDLDFETDKQYPHKIPQRASRKCQMCHKTMAKGVSKKHHMLLEHFTLYVSCGACRESQKSDADSDACSKLNLIEINEYCQHMTSAHQTTEFGCMFCKVSSFHSDADLFRDHLVKKHSTELICRCTLCHDEKAKLPDDRGLIRAVSLNGHIACKHVPDKSRQVPCKLCGALIAECNMAKHMKNLHEEKIPNESSLCDICGKYFVQLKQHRTSVHKRESWMHKCKTCGKLFAKRYNMEVHSRLHTGERPFVCEVCGKGFCQNVELKSHMKNNHDRKKADRRSRKTQNREATSVGTQNREATSVLSLAKNDYPASQNNVPVIAATKPTTDVGTPRSTETAASHGYSIVGQGALGTLHQPAFQDQIFATLGMSYPVTVDGVVLTGSTTQCGSVQNLDLHDIHWVRDSHASNS